jgi:hypothetical protein
MSEVLLPFDVIVFGYLGKTLERVTDDEGSACADSSVRELGTAAAEECAALDDELPE